MSTYYDNFIGAVICPVSPSEGTSGNSSGKGGKSRGKGKRSRREMDEKRIRETEEWLRGQEANEGADASESANVDSNGKSSNVKSTILKPSLPQFRYAVSFLT